MRRTIGRLRKHFARQERIQENVQKLSREIIRNASRAISAIHRGNFKTANALIRKSGENLKSFEALLDEEGWGMFYNVLVSAQQEYAEAVMLASILKNGTLPDLESLGVFPRAYAFALADVAGELYRVFLNGVRNGDRRESEKILGVMEEIFEMLMELDFPQSVLPGMKHKQDRVRRIVEQARRDFTLAFMEGG
ncbi:MAG: hypothetical protein QXU01_04080 [Candidatus Hadarchaeales archaeon]